MGRKKLKSASKNTRLAVLFFVFIFCIVTFSLVFKGILMVKQSKFDNNHRFTISFSNGKMFEILSFSPISRQISVLRINGDVKGIDIKKLLAIYTDGEIISNLRDIDSENVESLMWRSLKSFNSLKTNLGIVDVIRLFFFSRTVPEREIIIKNISLGQSAQETDKIVDNLFSDKSIEKDKQTIEIVNGTEISGLGSWLSRLLTKIGANVVLVSTSDVLLEKSSVYYSGKKTYTIEKVSKILRLNTLKKDEQGIADIVISIGRDSISRFSY